MLSGALSLLSEEKDMSRPCLVPCSWEPYPCFTFHLTQFVWFFHFWFFCSLIFVSLSHLLFLTSLSYSHLFSFFAAILLFIPSSWPLLFLSNHVLPHCEDSNVTTKIILLFRPWADWLCDTVCTPSFWHGPLFGTFPLLSICSGTSDTVQKPQISWFVLVIIVDVALIITSGVETEESKCSPCGPAWPDLTQLRAAVAWLLWLQNIAC